MVVKEVAIIGVGKFGTGVIERIIDISHIDIIAVDNDETRLKRINNLKKYYVGDASDEKFLTSLGLKSIDVFVIGIGDNVEASLLIASIIKSNWPKSRIIAKAVTIHHEKILQQIGIKEIVNPERAAARGAALKIINPLIGSLITKNDEIRELEGGISLVKIKAFEKIINLKISKIDIPKAVSIVLIYKKGRPYIVDGNTMIEKDDKILIIGKSAKIMSFIAKA